MPIWLYPVLTLRYRNLLIHAAAIMFAVGFSMLCILVTDLALPGFTARFDNYAFSAAIPIAAAPIIIYPILWLLRRVEQTQSALEHMARTDALTDVLNRRGFFEAAEAASANGNPIALMMVDIDRFKQVNDLYGHAAGDELLKHLARLIQATVRDEGGLVGRLGGEEFAILLAGADEPQAKQLAEDLCRATRISVLQHDGHRIGATFSVGVAIGRPGDRVDDVLKRADRAAYGAKGMGRDGWLLAAPEPEGEAPLLTAKTREAA